MRSQSTNSWPTHVASSGVGCSEIGSHFHQFPAVLKKTVYKKTTYVNTRNINITITRLVSIHVVRRCDDTVDKKRVHSCVLKHLDKKRLKYCVLKHLFLKQVHQPKNRRKPQEMFFQTSYLFHVFKNLRPPKITKGPRTNS